MDELNMATDEELVELPDKIQIDPLRLEPGLPFCQSMWGMRYRFKNETDWHTMGMAFANKDDAAGWISEKIHAPFGYADVESQVVPVKKCSILTVDGQIVNSYETLTKSMLE